MNNKFQDKEVGQEFTELSKEEMEVAQGAGDDVNGETFWASAAISGATGIIISTIIKH